MKLMKFRWQHVVAVIGVILVTFMVMDFNDRQSDLHRLGREWSEVKAEKAGLETEQAFLKTQIAQATQISAVYRWAYEDGHMKLPGDNPVVPLPPLGSTPVPTPASMVERPVVSNWQMWLLLFVDSISP